MALGLTIDPLAYDRGRKFEHYRSIASLREYLLVSLTEARVERFRRTDAG